MHKVILIKQYSTGAAILEPGDHTMNDAELERAMRLGVVEIKEKKPTANKSTKPSRTK